MSSVLSVDQRFSSFGELDNALKRYQAEAFCVLVERGSRSIQAAQKRLSNKTRTFPRHQSKFSKLATILFTTIATTNHFRFSRTGAILNYKM